MPGRGGSGNGVAGFFDAATFFGGGAAFFAAGFFLGAALLRVLIHALRRGRQARKFLVKPCGSSQRNRLNAYTIWNFRHFAGGLSDPPDALAGPVVFDYK